MAIIREFKGLRPKQELAPKVAELPYDVVNAEEAAAIAAGNQYSFFRISRAEIDIPGCKDNYSPEVYRKGKENLEKFTADGIMIQDSSPCLYLYTQIMNGRSQTGLVSCVSIDDYINNRIKKHELTREDKETDRSTHLDILSANTGPVFLMFREDGSAKDIFARAAAIKPVNEFTAVDGITHIFRVIDDPAMIAEFKKVLADNIFYIADGHHRAASAVRVGLARRDKNPGYSGEEEFNFFLAVVFPHDQLKILPYNRAVKDLNGKSPQQFMEALKEKFSVDESAIKSPENLHTVSMYIDKKWYLLKPKFPISKDPIDSLDVKILQDNLLSPILGIHNPRTDKRIDFIGGIRGTAELEKIVDSGKFAVAFSMYPTTLEQLMDVSDAGSIMPPKSTWFEPKLRSGLVLHLL
jgi:uncharacterized protein (DUF1015 family)